MTDPVLTRTDPRTTARSMRVVGAVAFAVAAMAMMQTISIPLLPALPGIFDTSIATASWVASTTLIVGAVANPVIGRMGDVYGKRNLLLACLALAVVGSLVGATTSSLAVLVVGRAIQGIGSGVIPLAYGIVRDEVAPRHVARSVAAVTAAGVALGAGLGPVIMGLVLSSTGWRAVLWSTVGVCATALVVAIVLVPSSSLRFPARFDRWGAVGLSAALLALLVAITKGADWGWGSARVLGCLGAAIVLGTAWFRFERRRDAPLVDVRVSSSGPVLLSHLGGFMVGFATFTQFIVTFSLVALPRETGFGLGESAAVAGLIHLPGSAVVAIAVMVAARACVTRGPAAVLTVGAAIVAVGFTVGVVWHGSVAELVVGIVVVNIGIGLSFAALPLLIIENVGVDETAAVNAINALARTLGSVLASAGVSAVLATGSVLLAGGLHPQEWTYRVADALAAAVAATLVVLAIAMRARNPKDPLVVIPHESYGQTRASGPSLLADDS